MNKTLIPKFFYFSLFISLCFNAFSQKKDFLGVNISGEIRAEGENMILNNKVGMLIGFSYERKFHNNFGAETGILYRANPVNIYFPDVNINQRTIIEGFVSVPVLLKFYSGIINISLGGCFDYFIGGYDPQPMLYSKLIAYDINPKYFLGIVCKVSKDIKISEKLILEPELKYSAYPPPGDFSYFGIGIKVKYGL